MIFDYMPSDGLLKAVCIYRMIGDTLSIELFEVNKDYRQIKSGSSNRAWLLSSCSQNDI